MIARGRAGEVVFERDQGGAGNWGEVAKRTASDGETLDRLGNSICVDGDVLAAARVADHATAADASALPGVLEIRDAVFAPRPEGR